MIRLALAALLAGLPVMAAAEDAALILGIERYEQLGRVSRADDAVAAAEGLEALGFAVTAVPNARSGNAVAALDQWLSASAGAERLVAVLTGHFVNDGRRSWLLTADVGEVTLFGLGDRAVSVDSVLQVLAQRPGQAVLLIGPEDEDDVIGFGLRAGVSLAGMEIPQGVTVVYGTAPNIAAFAEDDLAEPGADLMAQVGEYRRLTASGYAPGSLMLMPETAPETPVVTQPTGPDAAEVALWNGARTLDTVEAYRNYLTRYPNGGFIDAAEEAIAAIIAEPNRDARLIEEGLRLSRDDRRDIQRNLTLLGYGTRGVDGIFGSGTRSAITNWQQQNGFAQTSYLTEEQILRLDAQATRRSAEIEAEAERQRAAAAQQDRAYWEETGARGDEPGFRAYLGRFPDGLYAEFAQTRLDAIEAQRRQVADTQDRNAWDGVRATDTVAAYQGYLQGFPNGQFRAEAQARITELTEEASNDGRNAAARAAEEALSLNALTARLVESRLDQLGLNPGTVDGTFDRATRRALRNYQRDRELDVTGFLDEMTLIRILADSFEAQN